VIVLFLIAFSQIYIYGKGDWYALFTMPLAIWILTVNVFHDASHFSLSMNWMVNKVGVDVAFMFNTPYVWYH
jgi:delta11-fatty-acid desaturase